MASNDYHFITHWRVRGTVDEVAQIIGDAPSLARWWPSVYLDVQEIESGDVQGVGKVIDLYTKGWLPYTLRWRFRIADVQPARSITLEAQGDFVGRGIWTFAQDGAWVDLTYDWQIRAEKPLLRWLSPLLKPVFSANHRWAMRQGEESLWLELERCRATTPADLARIPPPPGPTPSWSPWVLVGAFAAVGALCALRRRRG